MAEFTIRPDKSSKPFRKLHGMNLAAPVTNARRCRVISEYLRKLNIPQTRMHNCPLNNPGKNMVPGAGLEPAEL